MEKEKNFNPEFRSSRPELENSKKIAKKFKKLIKHNSGIISIQNKMG